MIKVSVVVPVYKSEKSIDKCIKSIINQTITDIEIILIDDGSPDNSGKICDEYALKDERIKVIHKSNGGVSSARNRGIEEASGEYIVFVDSDDWVEKEYIETLLEIKEKYADSESICSYKVITSDNETDFSTISFSDNEEVSVIPFNKYMELIVHILAQSPWNKLFKRSVINESKIRFDESISLGEDIIFCLDYYNKCGKSNIVCVNQALYNYTMFGNETLSNKYYPDLVQIDERIHSKIKDFIISHNADKYQIEIYNNNRFFSYISVLDNTYKKANLSSKSEKRNTNNKILRSPEFKEALKNTTSLINPLQKLSYKSGSWTLVQLVNKLKTMRKILKRGNHG